MKIYDPVGRQILLNIYKQADFLFLHLNSYKAFEKVLPSKLFEYGAYDVPIIAGVDGYARQFISENLENAILFEPCNCKQLIQLIKGFSIRRKGKSYF